MSGPCFALCAMDFRYEAGNDTLFFFPFFSLKFYTQFIRIVNFFLTFKSAF